MTALGLKRAVPAVAGLVLLSWVSVRIWKKASDLGEASSPARPAIHGLLPAGSVREGLELAGAASSGQRVDFVSILQSQDAGLRRQGLGEEGRRLGLAAPAQGWTMLERISGLADRECFATALLREWAMKDPQAALSACAGLAAGELRAMAYAAALGGWAHKSPVEAADWSVRHLVGSNRRSAIGEVVRTWAQSEPEAAARWALSQSGSVSGRVAIQEVMRYWAGNDPEAGAEWAAKQPAGPFQQAALEAVMSEWADQFPEKAAQWVMKTPGAAGFAPEVAGQWAKADPGAAAEWAREIKDKSLRSELLPVITTTWAASDPEAAAAWVAGVQDAEERIAGQAAIAQAWAEDDPSACLDWVQKLPSDETQLKLGDAAFGAWAGASADTLAAWLQKQKEGALKDRGLVKLAEVWASDQPQAALQAALAVHDADFAQEAAVQVYNDWKSRDPRAAAQWLAGQPRLVSFLNPEQ
jgi:hypothetical protein